MKREFDMNKVPLKGNFDYKVDLKFSSITPFFNNESALLLESIDDTHSIKEACERVNISYSKGWTMIRNIEKETGIRFVIKTLGGFKGGHTVLTDEGREFVRDYRNIVSKMQDTADKMLERTFDKYKRSGSGDDRSTSADKMSDVSLL